VPHHKSALEGFQIVSHLRSPVDLCGNVGCQVKTNLQIKDVVY